MTLSTRDKVILVQMKKETHRSVCAGQRCLVQATRDFLQLSLPYNWLSWVGLLAINHWVSTSGCLDCLLDIAICRTQGYASSPALKSFFWLIPIEPLIPLHAFRLGIPCPYRSHVYSINIVLRQWKASVVSDMIELMLCMCRKNRWIK